MGGGNKDYIKQFPGGLDELSQFDVVFLGDVGVGDGQLTDEQCGWLKGLVEHQASGIVFMPGWQGRQLSLLETELDELYPVVLDEAQRSGWGSSTPCHFDLTELGRRSLLTKLADTEEENREVWEGLPGFQWYAPVVRARAGCEVLAVHKDAENKFGRMPLLVDAHLRRRQGPVHGHRRRLALAQRRRRQVPLSLLGPGRALDGLSAQHGQGRNDAAVLFARPAANRRDRDAQRQRDGPKRRAAARRRRVGADHGPFRQSRNHRLSVVRTSSGAPSRRSSRPESPANTRSCSPASRPAPPWKRRSSSRATRVERAGRPARPEVLEEIARVTRGKVIGADRPDEIVSSLASLPEPPPSVRRLQLWSHPAVAGALIVLLGVFWVGRKAIGVDMMRG